MGMLKSLDVFYELNCWRFQTVTHRLKSQYPSSMRRKKKTAALSPCDFQQQELIL